MDKPLYEAVLGRSDSLHHRSFITITARDDSHAATIAHRWLRVRRLVADDGPHWDLWWVRTKPLPHKRPEVIAWGDHYGTVLSLISRVRRPGQGG